VIEYYSTRRRDLVRIGNGLGTTPLLGLDGMRPTKRGVMLDRLSISAKQLSDKELRITVIQTEAVVRKN